jgi:hypothetical protein
MTNSELVVRVLIEGALGAFALVVIAFLLSRFAREVCGRSLLVIFLFMAAGAYFGFALLARDLLGTAPIWILVEILQVIAFGTMGLLGWRGSPWWLALGWALHPAWDFVLHYVGPGRSFAPWTYAVACISFDWLVAAYVAVAYGLIGARRLGFRNAAS